ncbi:hypothetical protein PGTUg99_015013 [Puccinia graminis f. sp. tritici]|uniref:Uncharacterized protein n=1 Tax=Puccinia graminis f. sp. tritici TaxID=56615 RepID=A0A5B0QRP2_PUCGR|nr:hypothetical protein PGTUg99_015013 [Puccinia graminis f. sp. tritici]
MKFSMGFSFITLLIPQAQCLLSQRSSSPAEELKETERNIGSSSRFSPRGLVNHSGEEGLPEIDFLSRWKPMEGDSRRNPPVQDSAPSIETHSDNYHEYGHRDKKMKAHATDQGNTSKAKLVGKSDDQDWLNLKLGPSIHPLHAKYVDQDGNGTAKLRDWFQNLR